MISMHVVALCCGKTIKKSPCTRDGGGHCLDFDTLTAVEVECWHHGYPLGDGRIATTFQVFTEISCGEPVQEGYIFDIDDNMEFGLSSKVSVLSCDIGYSGVPSVDTVFCREDGMWDDVTGCSTIGCGPPSKAGYTYGAIIDTMPRSIVSVLSCDTGYLGTPSTGHVTCLDEFAWTDVTGCYPNSCEYTTIENGVIDFADGFEYSSVAKITCQKGYQLNGSNTTTCLENGFWDITSECIITDCGPPHEVSNGQVDFTNAVTTYGQFLPITCNTGYESNDGNGTDCLSEGRWSTSTTCQPKDCGDRFTIPKGKVSFDGADTTYGNLIPIICDDGHELIGGSDIKCLSNGDWFSNSSCEVRDCGTNHNILNGHVDFTNKKTTYGYFVPIICNDGYMLTGGEGIECLSSGSWSDYTTCEIKDKCWPYKRDSSEPNKCRVTLLPYGEEAGDAFLPKADDLCGQIIHTQIDIPIFGVIHNKLIPCTNGYVTFDTLYNKWRPPGDIQDIKDRTLLAPYFSDVDIRGTHGAVYYQTYSSFSGSTRSQAVQLAETYVRDMTRDDDFNARFVLVVTWHQVPSYPYYGSWWCFWWRWWGCSSSDVSAWKNTSSSCFTPCHFNLCYFISEVVHVNSLVMKT